MFGSTPTYTFAQLAGLRDALAKGEKRVLGDKTVEYRSIDELTAAIHEVEVALQKDAVTTGLIPRAARQIRIVPAKGS